MIVFDLDGTIALNDHRQHFVERPKGQKDWYAFFEACDYGCAKLRTDPDSIRFA